MCARFCLRRPLEARLLGIRLRAPRRVGNRLLQICTVVEQRVVPRSRRVIRILGRGKRHVPLALPRIRCSRAGRLHKGHGARDRAPPARREEVVQHDGTHVSFQIDPGQVERKRANALRRGRTDSRQRLELRRIVREQAVVIARHDFCRRFERQRAPVVAHALPRCEHSLVGAQARASTVGNRSSHSSQTRHHARDLRLLQHDLRQPDGIRSRVRRHGRSRYRRAPSARTNVRKGADVIHGCSFGTGQERARARYLACGQHSLQETYVQNALRSANLGSTAGAFVPCTTSSSVTESR